jgi:hypothetical protein
LVQASGLKQRCRRVVDDGQPIVGGVAVSLAVDLERPVTAVKGVRRIVLGGDEELVREFRLGAVGEGVNKVIALARRAIGRSGAASGPVSS